MPQSISSTLVPYLLFLGDMFSEQIGSRKSDRGLFARIFRIIDILVGTMNDDFTYMYSVNYTTLHVYICKCTHITHICIIHCFIFVHHTRPSIWSCIVLIYVKVKCFFMAWLTGDIHVALLKIQGQSLESVGYLSIRRPVFTWPSSSSHAMI